MFFKEDQTMENPTCLQQELHRENHTLQMQTSHFPNSSNQTIFGPELSIKHQESNFLVWNQQIEGVILSKKFHKYVVNPQNFLIFKTKKILCSEHKI